MDAELIDDEQPPPPHVLGYGTAARGSARWARISRRPVVAFPPVAVGTVATTWAIARVVLGHSPEVCVDPTDASPVLDALSGAVLLLVVSAPLTFTLGPALAIVCAIEMGDPPNRFVLRVAGVLVEYAAAAALLWWDPLHVVRWVLD